MGVLKDAAAYAPLATATIATAALIIAVVQISINKAVQKDVRVKNLYARFVEVSIANADITRSKFDEYDFRYFEGSERELRIKYSWYVSYTMDVCEEIYLLKPDSSWIKTVEHQIQAHKDFINSNYCRTNNFVGLYNEKFGSFVVNQVKQLGAG